MSEFCTLCNLKPASATCSICHQKICANCASSANSISNSRPGVLCSSCLKDSSLKEYVSVKGSLF